MQTCRSGQPENKSDDSTLTQWRSGITTARSKGRMIHALDTGRRLPSTSLTYYFFKPGDGGLLASTSLANRPKRLWTETQKSSLRRALQEWADVSAFSFTETQVKGEADIKAVMVDDPSYTYLGEARFPGDRGQGELYISYRAATHKDFPPGSFDYITLLHELGHVFGLAHPHDGGGTSSLFPGVRHAFHTGKHGQNQTVYTVMSYNDVTGPITPDVIKETGFVTGPMAYDVAAIQAMYPLSSDHVVDAGDTVHRLPKAGEGAAFKLIRDTGGTDVIDASGSSHKVRIDLRDATLDGGRQGGGGVSRVVGHDAGGFTIAAGSHIENATGGAGADVLIGNEGANVLRGGGGNDKAWGGSGRDVFHPGKGSNYFHGGRDRDTLVLPGSPGNYRIYRLARRKVVFKPAGGMAKQIGSTTTDFVEYAYFEKSGKAYRIFGDLKLRRKRRRRRRR